jgi:uncharacterized protein YcfJ
MHRTLGLAILAALGGLAVAGVATHHAVTANNPAAVQPAVAAVPVAPVPAGAPVVTRASDEKVQTTVVQRTTVSRRAPRYYVHKRSTKHSVAIIGGSTLGGAGIGALVGGKKGAVIGGLVGGTAGTVYDRKTRKKVKRVE